MIELKPSADHPVPYDIADETPATHKDAVAVAVNTADLLDQLGGSVEYGDADFAKAVNLIKGATKPDNPAHIKSPAEAQAVADILKRFDFGAFADAMQARNFITNKLIKIADCGDTRLELKALELLGKHSDIGLFTERSEITVHHTSSKSLEESITERVKRLLNSDVVDVTPLDDLDAQLGPPPDTLTAEIVEKVEEKTEENNEEVDK